MIRKKSVTARIGQAVRMSIVRYVKNPDDIQARQKLHYMEYTFREALEWDLRCKAGNWKRGDPAKQQQAIKNKLQRFIKDTEAKFGLKIPFNVN